MDLSIGGRREYKTNLYKSSQSLPESRPLYFVVFADRADVFAERASFRAWGGLARMLRESSFPVEINAL